MVEKTWDILPFTSPKKKIHIGCMKTRVGLFLSLTECMSVSSCVSPSFLCFLIAILETATNNKMSLPSFDAQ